MQVKNLQLGGVAAAVRGCGICRRLFDMHFSALDVERPCDSLARLKAVFPSRGVRDNVSTGKVLDVWRSGNLGSLFLLASSI